MRILDARGIGGVLSFCDDSRQLVPLLCEMKLEPLDPQLLNPTDNLGEFLLQRGPELATTAGICAFNCPELMGKKRLLKSLLWHAHSEPVSTTSVSTSKHG
jgi:hypothetical protein